MEKQDKAKSKAAADAMKLKYWQQARAAHKPKNRSSKHLRFFHTKDIYRCLGNAVLKEWSANGNFNATQELARRDRKRAKKLSA